MNQCGWLWDWLWDFFCPFFFWFMQFNIYSAIYFTSRFKWKLTGLKHNLAPQHYLFIGDSQAPRPNFQLVVSSKPDFLGLHSPKRYTSDWPAAALGRRSCVMSSRDKRRARPQGPEWPRICPKRPHNQGEILQTCSMRTDVVSNSPPTLLPDESAPLSRSQSWTVSGLSHRYC